VQSLRRLPEGPARHQPRRRRAGRRRAAVAGPRGGARDRPRPQAPRRHRRRARHDPARAHRAGRQAGRAQPSRRRRATRLWRRRRNLTVVALDAPLTAAGAAAARAFLTALQPSRVWGVVEATRKAHDVGRWTRALGGVDALALTAVEETADPASVLTSASRSAGSARQGHAGAWAALLTERMAA
jgi:hypothetical protein